MQLLTAASLLLSLLPHVSAHGRITNITTASGVDYTGWDPALSTPPNSSIPSSFSTALVAWSASNLGNVFIYPSQFGTSNITCHIDAYPGEDHIPTTAGDTLRLQWNEWPVSHKGPVMAYLASCNQSCTEVDKEKLEWVKIDELGWLNSTGLADLGGTWATDVLIANDFSWTVKVPEGLQAGAYVIRHEIIALHVADQKNGAQAYPQCVNIRVGTSGASQAGTKAITGGVLGEQLYKADDAGILVDIHKTISSYAIPGPKVWSGATQFVQPNEKRKARRTE